MRKPPELTAAANFCNDRVNPAYVPLSILEKPPYPISCKRCSAPLAFFYPPEEFFSALKKAFTDKIIATFLFNPDAQLLGFALGWETTIGQGWQDKILSGYGDKQQASLPWKRYLEEIATYIGPDAHESSRAFNSAEWAMASPIRKSGVSLPLYYANISSAFEVMSESGEDIPVIGHSLVDSKALKIFCAVGFQHGQKFAGSRRVRVYSTLKRLLRDLTTTAQR